MQPSWKVQARMVEGKESRLLHLHPMQIRWNEVDEQKHDQARRDHESSVHGRSLPVVAGSHVVPNSCGGQWTGHRPPSRIAHPLRLGSWTNRCCSARTRCQSQPWIGRLPFESAPFQDARNHVLKPRRSCTSHVLVFALVPQTRTESTTSERDRLTRSKTSSGRTTVPLPYLPRTTNIPHPLWHILSTVDRAYPVLAPQRSMGG